MELGLNIATSYYPFYFKDRTFIPNIKKFLKCFLGSAIFTYFLWEDPQIYSFSGRYPDPW